MNISIITLFPDLYDQFLNTSLLKRAIEKGVIGVDVKNMFDYVEPKKRIDSPVFGPGTGMLIRPEIVQQAIESQESKYGPAYKIFFSPQGTKLDQLILKKIFCQASELTKEDILEGKDLNVRDLDKKAHVMLLPARYEGMDSRIEDHYADLILSIGDFVLMGGDLPAMVLLEGLLRLVPGVIAKAESVEKDSFTGSFIDYPEFTGPVDWNGYKVPDVIRSGNHKEVNDWRESAAINKTVIHHFEWLRSHVQEKKDIIASLKYIPQHYVVLMHSDVMLESERQGTSSVTSLDIHDIARSARTYGLSKYFIVTPLLDQQKVVNKLLDFWLNKEGFSYNANRYDAIKNVSLKSDFDSVIESIKLETGKDPVIIGTTARKVEGVDYLFYDEHEKVWSHDRPVLFVLGTARGLAPVLLDKCDYILEPIIGFSPFNHLSVRSAASIIFDRWLGVNLTHRIKYDQSC